MTTNATTLHLYNRGLCGVIPWRDGSRTGADVALVNAQGTTPKAMEHAALLKVHNGKVEVKGDPGPRIEKQWRVEGRAIRIGDGVVAPDAKGLTLVRQDRNYPWQGLQWILSMLVIAPDCTPRADVGIGAGGRVSTALRLVDGTLQGSPPSHGKLGLWRVRELTTALSDSILYTLDCAVGYVEFQFAELKADGRRVGAIRISPDGLERDIVVSLTNLPAAEHRHARGDVGHVSAAYDLFDGVPQAAPVPVFIGLIDRVSSPVETDDDPPNCIHAIHLPLPPDPPPLTRPGPFPPYLA